MRTKFNHTLNRFFDLTETIFSFFNAILVTIMIVVVVLDVFSTLLKYPITITTELTGLTFAWITGFSGVIITMRDGNIALDIVKTKFKGTAKIIVDTVIDMICIAFSWLMFTASWEMCVSMKELYMPLFRFPKTVLYLSMLLMFGMITLVLLLRIIQRFVNLEVHHE
ncbi:MAG: TRAP transporter small permease [Hungatella sp.]|nr:TRAP transporter small permease [Hungatella sp.]